MLCLEVLTDDIPYAHHRDEADVLNDLIRGIHPVTTQHRASVSEEQAGALWRLMQQCWCNKSSERITPDGILKKWNSFDLAIRDLSALVLQVESSETRSGGFGSVRRMLLSRVGRREEEPSSSDLLPAASKTLRCYNGDVREKKVRHFTNFVLPFALTLLSEISKRSLSVE